MNEDPFNLTRFLTAQEHTYEPALAELKRGEKESHWMWFIFPQIDGLGHSDMAIRYAIKSRQEATAYLQHPVLGPRLLQCSGALLHIHGKTALDIMGYPDDLKLHSSMTLFAAVSNPGSVFHQVIDKYFQGQPDQNTIDILARG
ncbi:MAG: DUF1810 domain-containing protein [Chthoniobacteraceae bacterium]